MKLKTLTALLVLAGAGVHAQTVQVSDAWARASVPGQTATGAFMKITARQDSRLVGVASPSAGVAQVHEMKMDGAVMQMRALPNGLALPAGKTVELRPGGYHIMLMDMNASLPTGSTLALTLVFQDAKGAQSTLRLNVPVSTRAPAQAVPGKDAMSEHKH